MPLESHKSRTRGFYSGMQVSIRTKNLGAGWDRPTKNGSCFFQWWGVFLILLQMGGYGRKRYLDMKDVLQQIRTGFKRMKLAA